MDTFSEILALSPFPLEDLELALTHPSAVELIEQTHMTLLKLVIHDGRGRGLGSEKFSRRPLNTDTWQEILKMYLEKMIRGGDELEVIENGVDGSGSDDDGNQENKKSDFESIGSANPDIESRDENMNGKHIENGNPAEKNEPRESHQNGMKESAELDQIVKILEEEGWDGLDVGSRVTALRALCDRALDATVVREQIEGFMGTTKELKKEKREQETMERKLKKIEKEMADAKQDGKGEKGKDKKDMEALQVYFFGCFLSTLNLCYE